MEYETIYVHIGGHIDLQTVTGNTLPTSDFPVTSHNLGLSRAVGWHAIHNGVEHHGQYPYTHAPYWGIFLPDFSPVCFKRL